jgi:excisionase family DNA binding protein
MRTGVPRSLTHRLESLSLETILQGLVWVQTRQAQLAVLQSLLQAQLARRVSEPEKLLTAAEVAKRLNVPPGRVYELIRQRRLAKVTLGEKQVRIPASALTALSAHPVRHNGHREAVL